MPKYSQNNSQTSNKQHFVYTLNLEEGRKYIGMTSNPDQRLNSHFNGIGAKWLQKYKIESAKNAERILYYRMKNYYCSDKVRGVDNTLLIE